MSFTMVINTFDTGEGRPVRGALFIEEKYDFSRKASSRKKTRARVDGTVHASVRGGSSP